MSTRAISPELHAGGLSCTGGGDLSIPGYMLRPGLCIADSHCLAPYAYGLRARSRQRYVYAHSADPAGEFVSDLCEPEDRVCSL